MLALLDFVQIVLNLLWWVIIIGAILSWLLAFNVVNRNNQLVWSVWESLNKITEPLYRPIRRLLPSTGAFDFAPLVVLLGLIFVEVVVLGNLRVMLR